ncbi:hypothetical protein FCV25MIE_24986 [Fagus crenata]
MVSAFMGWVKCNFDAAIRDSGVVIAMVCRTNDGSVIQAWTELLQPGDAANVLNPLKENGEKPYCVMSSLSVGM